jgi:hypothetical protein
VTIKLALQFQTYPKERTNVKKQNAALLFLCGILLGISLTLCVGAGAQQPPPGKAAVPPPKSAIPPKPPEQATPVTATPPRHDWSKLKTMTFSTGVMGFFDPDTGRIYMYDVNLENCYSIREMTELGEPMRRVR